MKLKKIVRHLDFLCEAELYTFENGSEPVWKGSMVLLHAAALPKAEREQFFAECEADGDFKDIKKTKKAMKFMKYVLDTCIDYESISIRKEINKKGVNVTVFMINIKPEED